jgi:hypothetical protein
MNPFPQLPIITPGPDRKTIAEKYGGLFYLAIIGLVVCGLMVGIFVLGLWSMRSVWSDIYAVTDASQSNIDRINAAWRLSHDTRVNDRQKWDLALNKTPPPLARYLLAESLTSEAPTASSRAYILAVARSEGLPPFLRILLARPIAYAAAGGHVLDRTALEELSKHTDPNVAVWALFALALEDPPSPERLRLDMAELARKLQVAADLQPPARQEALDEATLWLRANNPECASIWQGWREDSKGITPSP